MWLNRLVQRFRDETNCVNQVSVFIPAASEALVKLCQLGQQTSCESGLPELAGPDTAGSVVHGLLSLAAQSALEVSDLFAVRFHDSILRTDN